MSHEGYLLGYDIGSSSIKASVMSLKTGTLVASAISSETELEILAKEHGWAEQEPEIWWDHVKRATTILRCKSNINLQDVQAIGISYQMHGLVMVDSEYNPIAPSIIWCDSRAVDIGNRAYNALGKEYCLRHFLNSPGNFTASKLKWVKSKQPNLYKKNHKIMLPGDYIAMKLTGEVSTTPTGLSEGILWDYRDMGLAKSLLDYYEIDKSVIPSVTDSFSLQGKVKISVAADLGIKPGTPVSYRAGDQPNNAFSLNVLNPGEIAATAGTSGVIYGVDDRPLYDFKNRVNTFIHVNHTPEKSRYGVLLCVNGTGILNSWIRSIMGAASTHPLQYDDMNSWAEKAPPGCDELAILPYGNGAERTLENNEPQASIHNLNYNVHNKSHIARASQEGIVFALRYGLDIMRSMKVPVSKIRAGYTNMFLSPLFTEVFATVCGAQVELYNTDGSQGAARGAGLGAGIYSSEKEAFQGLKTVKTVEPNNKLIETYAQIYSRWLSILNTQGIDTFNYDPVDLIFF